MTPSADAYWLALRRVYGVGPRIAGLLLQKFGEPQAVFNAAEAQLIATGIPRSTARAIQQFDAFEPLEKELCELPRIGARLIKWNDPDYPRNLRHIADPPPFLYIRGTLPSDDLRCVAVVGARAASDAGRHMGYRLGLELAAKGFTVVSGLARGIDAQAHQGALDAGGHTIAVMGCGVDVIYPTEHRHLADSIIEKGGALISELPIGTPPAAENFPTRNRILSGLSLGVVIVEAAEKSGSLITARMALEQDRQVFAVPGSPIVAKARGSNRLIKEGAILVECVEDVIEELAPQLAPRRIEAAAESASQGPSTALPGSISDGSRGQNAPPESARSDLKTDEGLILDKLKDGESLHVDFLIEESGLNAQTVLRLLLELELKGIVSQHPGKLFSLASA